MVIVSTQVHYLLASTWVCFPQSNWYVTSLSSLHEVQSSSMMYFTAGRFEFQVRHSVCVERECVGVPIKIGLLKILLKLISLWILSACVWVCSYRGVRRTLKWSGARSIFIMNFIKSPKKWSSAKRARYFYKSPKKWSGQNQTFSLHPYELTHVRTCTKDILSHLMKLPSISWAAHR